jgi:2-hydroxychromene-2-carboxylate isomerase
MFSQNALDNAQRLFKALAAREANLDEPIADDRIMDAAAQIGLEGEEFDSALTMPLSRAGSRTLK